MPWFLAQGATDEEVQGTLHRLITEIKQSLVRSQQIVLEEFLADMLWATALSIALGFLYVRFGRSMSNRRAFASNFVLMTMTTMVIITLVKASLALSLGLVGALSIVRYRTAIKEPEELAFLFVAIAIGLGFGAHQGMVTTAAFLMIGGVIVVRAFVQRRFDGQSLNLLVVAQDEKVTLDAIVASLEPNCDGLQLRRLDQEQERLEASFLVQFRSFEQLQASRKQLLELDEKISISYLASTASA